MKRSGIPGGHRGRRFVFGALAVAVVLGIATAVAVPLERASITASAAKHTTPAKAVHMGSYPISKYSAAATALPAALGIALKQDVNESPAEYLASAAAAAQAVKVVAALKAAGVHVLGSHLDGTRLTVNVGSKADAAAVDAVGGTPVVGAPKKLALPKKPFHTVDQTYPTPPAGTGSIDLWGGDPYTFADSAGDGFECSAGFNGFTPSGTREFLTAGHCTTQVDGDVNWVNTNGPGDDPTTSTCYDCGTLGVPVAGKSKFGNGLDFGLVNVQSEVTIGALTTWTSAGGENTAPLYIAGESAGIVGATLCKSGATSGWTCGTILAVDEPAEVADDGGDIHTVNSIVATTCLLPGDSGGGAVIGQDAVGIDSASDFPEEADADDPNGYPCGDPDTDGDPADSDYYSLFFPMVSAAGSQSVQGQLGSSWQIETGVHAPVITSPLGYPAPPGAVTPNSYVVGTLADATPTSKVSLYLVSRSGKNIPWATVSAASGSWKIPLSGDIPTDVHGYSVIASDGFNVGGGPASDFSMTSACSPPSNTVPSIAIRPAGVGDFNCDAAPDVIARDSAGTLWLYPGNSADGFVQVNGPGLSARKQLSTSWQGMTAIVSVGDFNGDQFPDVVARDGNGTLWLYPGNGNGLGARTQIATGWGGMTAIEGVGDFNNDGFTDIVARTSAGALDLYPGNGSGGLDAPVQLATGWQSMTAIIGPGDLNGDGFPDLLARDAAGTLWLYPGTLSGGLGSRVEVSGGWQSYTILPAGDFGFTDTEDILARDSSGVLWLYPGNGTGGVTARHEVGTGFGPYSLAGDGSSIHAVIPPPAAGVSGGVGDFNGDGSRDVIARDSSGSLWLYPGNGSNGFGARVGLGAGWQSMTAIVPVGDFNGDGHPDLVARDSAGTLWLYPGNGSNGFGARSQIATGWQDMTSIQGVADFDGDGHLDLVARDASGNLWLYPGDGFGGVGPRVSIAGSWNGLTSIIGVGDFNGDGHADLVARDASGTLWLYPGDGRGGVGARAEIGGGWGAYTIVAVGDFNKDGYQDVVARDAAGALWLYPGNGSGKFGTRVEVGSGWTSYYLAGDGASLALPATSNLTTGIDFNGDGSTDVLARDSSGVLWMYPGNGSAGLLPRVQLAAGFGSLSAIAPVGDFDGDGHPDIVARDSAGVLWLYPGNGSNGFAARVQLATGWQTMTAIQGVGDFDGDGKVDVIARDSSGVLWLYPGNGSNALGTRVQLATGWAGMTAILGIGDFNHDGNTDVVARDSTGALWLYPGDGHGSLETRVALGTGWQGYTIAAVGDFNRDGNPDVIARDSSGALWLYPGNGSGGWLARRSVGSGFGPYSIAGDGSTLR